MAIARSPDLFPVIPVGLSTGLPMCRLGFLGTTHRTRESMRITHHVEEREAESELSPFRPGLCPIGLCSR